MAIISISGAAGSGKDLSAKIIQEIFLDPKASEATLWLRVANSRRLDRELGSWEIKKFASTLKHIVASITGCSISDLESEKFKSQKLPPKWKKTNGQVEEHLTYRELLQKIGTDMFRNVFHEDIWVDSLLTKYSPSKKWIITDTRFPNELEAIKKLDGLAIKIIRNNKENVAGNHISETALDSSKFDYYVNNSGSEYDLIQKLKLILTQEKFI